MDIKIKFWGVRGSRPTPRKDTILFGGNTSCIQMQLGGRNFIFDGGTGLAELGKAMVKSQLGQGEIFFSHLHWDHIQGIPFFTPLYVKGNSFRLYGEDKEGMKFEEAIKSQMMPPWFPVTMDTMNADYEFISIGPKMELTFDEDIRVKTFALNHPNQSLAFRIEKGNSSVVYCTDTEPVEEDRKAKFYDFLRAADVLIYDSHFTDEEYYGLVDGEHKKKWGHSTWEEGVRISREADIAYLLLFHHKEDRTDEELKEIQQQSQGKFKNSLVAMEGMTIEIGGGSPEKVVINYPH